MAQYGNVFSQKDDTKKMMVTNVIKMFVHIFEGKPTNTEQVVKTLE